MRKILFLDIDGVVNWKDTYTKYPEMYHPIDPYCAFLVGKIRLDTDCDVVLSSSWRHHAESVEHIKKHVVPLIDITGHCCSGIRGVEIHNWLTKNVQGFNSASYKEGKDHVANIAILDDDSDMLLWQKDHFFRTSFYDGGLTAEIADRVIAHLNA